MKVLIGESFALLNRFRTEIMGIQTLDGVVVMEWGGGGWIDTASVRVYET